MVLVILKLSSLSSQVPNQTRAAKVYVSLVKICERELTKTRIFLFIHSKTKWSSLPKYKGRESCFNLQLQNDLCRGLSACGSSLLFLDRTNFTVSSKKKHVLVGSSPLL